MIKAKSFTSDSMLRFGRSGWKKGRFIFKEIESVKEEEIKEEEKMKPIKFYLQLFTSLLFMMGLVLPVVAHSKEVKNLSANVGPGSNVFQAARTLALFLQMEDSTFFKAWGDSHVIIRGVNVPIRKVNLVYSGTRVFWDKAQRLFEVEVAEIGTIRDFQALLERNKGVWRRADDEVKPATTPSETQGKEGSASIIRVTKMTKKEGDDAQPFPPFIKKSKQLMPVPQLKQVALSKMKTDPLFDPDIDVWGLILDQTRTPLGQKFFRYFVSHWDAGDDDPFSLSIIEEGSRKTGVKVLVKVNDSIVHRTFLRSRAQDIEAVAKEGVRATRTYILERRMK